MQLHCKKKIKEFENEDFQDLDAMIIKLQKFVGATEPMEDEDMSELVEFLQDHFPDFALEEIKNAVHITIARQMDSDTKVENIRFFNATYLAGILRQYQKERSKVIIMYHKGEDQVARELIDNSNKEFAEENKDVIMQHLCITAFNGFASGVPIMGVLKIYDYLTTTGILVKPEEMLATFERLAETSLNLQQTTNRDLMNIIKNREKHMAKNYEMAKDLETKTLILNDFFTNLMAKKLHIADFYKKAPKKVEKPLIETKVKSSRGKKAAKKN